MKPKNKPVKLKKIDPGVRSRVLLVLLVIALVGFTMWISGPKPPADEPEVTPTKAPVTSLLTATVSPTATPQPLFGQTPTSGVIVGSVVIVLIIIIGTLVSLRQTKE